jgi:CopG family nickel-responsive transcriptional regulator
MDRFTVSLDADLLAQFDEHIRRRGYESRSEAVRDILRRTLEEERLAGEGDGHCVACLSYVYDHNERELPRRLTRVGHDHHDLTHSTLHVHLDHDNCMEVSILQGSVKAVNQFADALMAETGVRHGVMNAVPVERRMTAGHGHDGPSSKGHPHVHNRPKT